MDEFALFHETGEIRRHAVSLTLKHHRTLMSVQQLMRLKTELESADGGNMTPKVDSLSSARHL